MSTDNPESKLNSKQERFCEEYLVDLNRTQAAIRAGYSEKTAGSIGSENLQKPEIESYIQVLMDKRSERTEITADRVLTEIGKMAFANMADYTYVVDGALCASMDEVTRDQMAAIQEFTVDTRREYNSQDKTSDTIEKFRFKLADKRSSLELLGKHLKLFTETHVHTGADGKDLFPSDEASISEAARRIAFSLKQAEQNMVH